MYIHLETQSSMMYSTNAVLNREANEARSVMLSRISMTLMLLKIADVLQCCLNLCTDEVAEESGKQ